MSVSYVNRSGDASGFTMYVGDAFARGAQQSVMVTHDELMATLHAWIADGRARPKDIAKELGLPSPRVSEMLRGDRRIQQREMPILARYFGLDAPTDASVRLVKRVGNVPAGQLQQALAEATDTVEVSANLPHSVFALEVDGESMNLVAPLGCDVIVDPNDKTLFADDFYVVGDGAGSFTFKVFSQDPARLVPLSDDPSHKAILLGAEPVDIIGRVVAVQLNAGALRRMGRKLSSR